MPAEFDAAGRTRDAGRHELVVNGCRTGSVFVVDAVRVVLELDVVGARSRRFEHHGYRAAVLRDRLRHTATIGIKHIVAIQAEQRVKVPGRDRLRDGKGVIPAGTVTATQYKNAPGLTSVVIPWRSTA